MTEPVTTETDPEFAVESNEAPVLPVEINLEDPDADVLEQALPAMLDVEGYLHQ